MHNRMELAASRGDSLCIRAARGRIAHGDKKNIVVLRAVVLGRAEDGRIAGKTVKHVWTGIEETLDLHRRTGIADIREILAPKRGRADYDKRLHLERTSSTSSAIARASSVESPK